MLIKSGKKKERIHPLYLIKHSIAIGGFLFLAIVVVAQPYAKWTKTELKLNNGVVERTFQLPQSAGSFITTSYKPVTGDYRFFKKENTDFQFQINNHIYSGRSKWVLKNIVSHKDARAGDGAAVTLISGDKKFELTIEFLLYTNLPVVRKNLVIKNLTPTSLMLESVDVEKFETTDYWVSTFSWVCHDYGRRRSIGPYDGDMQDALVIVHNSDWQQGIVVGNEASGVLKHTAAFWDEPTIISGLTQRCPFSFQEIY